MYSSPKKKSNDGHDSKTLSSSNAECDKQATDRATENERLPRFSAAIVTVRVGFMVLLADLLVPFGTCCTALGLFLVPSCR
jgi:hypothetical protein